MPLSLTINALTLLRDTNVQAGINIPPITVIPDSSRNSSGVLSVPATAGGIPIPKNGLTHLGYSEFVNLDDTNEIRVMDSVGGSTILSKLKPNGGRALIFLGVTDPAAISLVNTCKMSYFISDGS